MRSDYTHLEPRGIEMPAGRDSRLPLSAAELQLYLEAAPGFESGYRNLDERLASRWPHPRHCDPGWLPLGGRLRRVSGDPRDDHEWSLCYDANSAKLSKSAIVPLPSLDVA